MFCSQRKSAAFGPGFEAGVLFNKGNCRASYATRVAAQWKPAACNSKLAGKLYNIQQGQEERKLLGRLKKKPNAPNHLSADDTYTTSQHTAVTRNVSYTAKLPHGHVLKRYGVFVQ
ncbi:hypothetical protein NPIL_151041 [Nephila pilipes]|uniref:Uncharacterized protein n=1 Tax=Nephila pilipes TaxID=299642 RepID=A0A8X6TJ21_NEPPI|nr:hypothetical protein NPIL_151041 [Nephila pilipes]